MANMYGVHLRAAGVTMGPVEAVIRNWYRMPLAKGTEVDNFLDQRVSIIDPNGAVIVAEAVIVQTDSDGDTIDFNIVPLHEMGAQ